MYGKISGFADEIAAEVDVQFEVLQRLQIRYFEPRGIDGKNISELSLEEARLLKEKMDKSQIRASSIGSPIGKVMLSDPFEDHFRLFTHVGEIAHILDTRNIRIFSFYHEGGDTWTDEERSQVLKRLERMISWARENDLVLLHENEKGIYGDTAERCADLMNELACENFQAVFDPANFVQCGVDTLKAYQMLQDHIAYMHIKDALYENGKVMPAGMGEGKVEEILKNLFDKGYEGFLSLEPHLSDFTGFAKLERGNHEPVTSLPGEQTFTLAFESLEKILGRLGR